MFNIYCSTIIVCISGDQITGGDADDHYICDSFLPGAISSEDTCVSDMENTHNRIQEWMTASSLKMNSEKQKFPYLEAGTSSIRSQLHISLLEPYSYYLYFN
jgi:hypothetical protein